MKNRQPAAALILHSPYTSIRDMARSIVGAVGGLILQRWNTADNLKRAGCPILILHAPNDDVIPFRQGESLFNARHYYGAACELFTQSSGADHNTFDLASDVIQPSCEFVSRHCILSSLQCSSAVSNPFSEDRVQATCATLRQLFKCPPGVLRGRPPATLLQRVGRSLGNSMTSSAALSAAAVSGSLASSVRATAGDSNLEDRAALQRSGQALQGVGTAVAAAAAIVPPAAPLLVPIGAATTISGLAASSASSAGQEQTRPHFISQGQSHEEPLINLDEDV